MTKRNTEPDFWARVDKSGGESACWPWIGCRKATGYGVIIYQGKKWRAHRLAFFFTHKHLSPSICHHCDNPSCCNPVHLFAGTHEANMADMKRKNRGRSSQGEKCWLAKLNEESVKKIRAEHSLGGITYRTLGNKYGVTPDAICRIVLRKNWTHIP